jgi:hypothetical protein
LDFGLITPGSAVGFGIMVEEPIFRQVIGVVPAGVKDAYGDSRIIWTDATCPSFINPYSLSGSI